MTRRDLVQNFLVFYCTITQLPGDAAGRLQDYTSFHLLHILIDNFRIYICLVHIELCGSR